MSLLPEAILPARVIFRMIKMTLWLVIQAPEYKRRWGGANLEHIMGKCLFALWQAVSIGDIVQTDADAVFSPCEICLH